MTKRNQSILLLVLAVALLVVISSRVGPKAATSEAPPEEPSATETPAPKETEPPEESEPPKRGRDLFPEASLNDWNLKLVNGVYVLSSSFVPDVTKARDEQYIELRAAEPLEAMLTAAEEAGYTVCLRNAYRPFSTQAYIFNGKASQIQWGTTMSLMDAETEARKVVAYPGTSEHQLGLCADILDTADRTLSADDVRGLPLLQWLTEHCAEYGFILRYPADKKEITGWDEPWHFRYVGEEIAAYIMENDLCLEEFIEQF